MKKNTFKSEITNKIVNANYAGSVYTCELSEYINNCPKCNHAILPGELNSTIFRDERLSIYKLSITYLCANCFNTFLCQYILPNGVKNSYRNSANLQYVEPKGVTTEDFSSLIKEISPEFIKLYNQSLNAEQMGLVDICGPGYRKALEFLIKDFAIKNYPEKKDTIEKTPLARCIDDYIDNQTIKDVAKAATWVGNDQTHYKQKHSDKNLDDLKLFIKLTINWIELYENTKIAKQFITTK